MPRLNIGDVELYYEIAGQGEPLLFMHGLGSSSRDWQLQVEFFAERYRVVAFDARGHGQSGKPPGPYGIPLFAQDTARLIEALDLAPVHVVGVSMGGMMALQLALDAPDLVRSMTVVNCTPEVVAHSWRDYVSLFQRLFVTRVLGMRKTGEFLGKRLFPRPEQEELRRMFVERWAENDKRAYLDATRGLVGWSVSERLGEIRCPTLVIAADEDYSPVEVKRAYVAQIPGAELVVIEDSRHGTPVDQPEKFNAALLEFLSRQA
jgi:pimeloyl-ACP methyl ester carboxylesterase